MRRVIALGIESGGKSEHMRGTELHAKTAGFAALDNDRNTSFCHANPQRGVTHHSGVDNTQAALWFGPSKDGVIVVT